MLHLLRRQSTYETHPLILSTPWIFKETREKVSLILLCRFALLAYFSEQQTCLALLQLFSQWAPTKSFPTLLLCCGRPRSYLSSFSWHLSILPQAVQRSFAGCAWMMRLWPLMEFLCYTWATRSGGIKWHLPCKPAMWPWTFGVMAVRVR